MEDTPRSTSKPASQKTAAEKKAAGKQAAEIKAAEIKAAEIKAAEIKAGGTKAASKKAAEQLVHRAYLAAVRLLGSRDHSEFELTRKLRKREHSDEAISGALLELQELNYVNDARYAVDYTRQRVERGFGPLSVRAKLRERGIEAHHVNAALAGHNVDWSQLALQALLGRFDEDVIASRKSRDEARIARFLAARGFASSDAFKALRAARRSL